MNRYYTFLSQDRCLVGMLKDLYSRVEDVRAFQLECLSLLQQLELEHLWRVLWVLRKAHRDLPLQEADLQRIADAIDEPAHWATRLCLGQLFAETGCPESVRETLFPFLEHAFQDHRPIVRAWALSALWTFQEDKRFRGEIRRMWQAAKKDPTKSVQARLRHLKVPV